MTNSNKVTNILSISAEMVMGIIFHYTFLYVMINEQQESVISTIFWHNDLLIDEWEIMFLYYVGMQWNIFRLRGMSNSIAWSLS